MSPFGPPWIQLSAMYLKEVGREDEQNRGDEVGREDEQGR